MQNKIVHVVLGKIDPEHISGLNRVVANLATNQSEMGYDVSLWCISTEPVGELPAGGYKTLTFVDFDSRFRLDPRIRQELSRLSSKNTVFHLHGGFIPQFYCLTRLLVKMGFQYVFTPQGAYSAVAAEHNYLKKKLYTKIFDTSLVPNAKALHFLEDCEVDAIEPPFGQTSPVSAADERGEAGLTHGDNVTTTSHPLVFGFVGRIDIHVKGLDLLLRGFSLSVRYLNLPAELWIIGDGPDMAQLRSMAEESGVAERIKFLGVKYGQEKLNIMAGMDYLCLTPRCEVSPGVVLEAARLGVPSIVSPETGMTEYIRAYRSGLCLESCSMPIDVCEVLLKASQWKDAGILSSVQQNARTMLEQAFNWKEVSKKLIDTYQA